MTEYELVEPLSSLRVEVRSCDELRGSAVGLFGDGLFCWNEAFAFPSLRDYYRVRDLSAVTAGGSLRSGINHEEYLRRAPGYNGIFIRGANYHVGATKRGPSHRIVVLDD